VVLFVWAAPWVLFGLTASERAGGLTFVWVGAGLLVAADFFLLLAVFLRTSSPLPPWAVTTGFILTFAALVAAFASADLAAAHHHVIDAHGHHLLADCYRNGAGVSDALAPVDAIYATLGTVTTAGAGEIVAHSASCRWMTASQLAIAFPMLGLSIGGVGARVFKQLE
jgi:hypothetical protein